MRENKSPQIVVLDGHTLNPGDNPWSDVEPLGGLKVYERTAPDDFLSRALSADILLTNKTPIGRDRIAQLPRLKFISVLATGYNVVDVAAAGERGIPVSNVPGYGTEAVAQHTLALILELSNNVGEHSRSVAAGDWERCPDFSYWKKPIRELRGLSLGIVGLGRVGWRVAELGHAFGMKILSASSPRKPGAFPISHLSIEDLFAESDFVSLHCPQTPQNYQFVNLPLLRRMKSSAHLINTARGSLIHEQDLAQALQENLIAGVALDVLSSEPPDQTNPLLHAPRWLITPHIAWSGLAARTRLMQTTAENIRGFLAGQPINQVTPD